MKIFVCFECVFNGADSWRSVVKIVKDEIVAIEWTTEIEATEYDWREYEQWDVIE